MPRKSSSVVIAVAPSRSFQRARTKVATIPGRPGAPNLQQTFPVVPKPAYRKARVRVLRKVDVSKGMTMPEGQVLPFVTGTPGAATGGYHGVRVLLQRPMSPPKIGGQTRKLIAAPSTTNRAGVRSPYNVSRIVGGRGKNTRYGKASGGGYSVGIKGRR